MIKVNNDLNTADYVNIIKKGNLTNSDTRYLPKIYVKI